MKEPQVKINGKTFLYKQKAPFVASGVSILGAIEYDAVEDKLRCHECGQWFEFLASHVVSKHGMSARDYKRRHGLRLKAALVSDRMRLANARFNSRTDNVARLALVRPEHELLVRAVRETRGGRYEVRNERGTCAAQLLARIRVVAERQGTLNRDELRRAGISVGSCFEVLGVRDFKSLAELAGFAISPNRRAYTKDLMVEMLRNFYVRFRRLPHKTDFRRGLLPWPATIWKHFGSMAAAYEAAGLGKVARREGRAA